MSHRRVAELFKQHFMNGNEDQDETTSTCSETIPFQEKVTNWLTQESADVSELIGTINDVPAEPDHWVSIDDDFGSVDKYQNYVAKTTAYRWLTASISRELAQATQEDNLLQLIHDEIWRRLAPLPKMSIRRPLHAENLIYRVDWHPNAFITEQRYSEDSSIALERAITLTGSPTDAQALPCLQYLNQTWPSSGRFVARLLQKLMHTERGQQVHGTTIHIPLFLR
jgi:hypothetical protein